MTPKAIEERLVFFPCGGSTLAGIVTAPPIPDGRTVLIPWGSGAFPSSGRNRIRTRLARALAAEGSHTFRFDYFGVGESDGDYRKPDLSRPNVEEILAAYNWLRGEGMTRILVVANCFGGWSTLMAAPMMPNLEGVVVVNAPVKRTHRQVRQSWQWWVHRLRRLSIRKLMHSRHRAAYRKLLASASTSLGRKALGRPIESSPSMPRAFSLAIGNLVDRKVPLMLLYGTGDFRADLDFELSNGLGSLLASAGPPTTVVTVEEGLERLASRAAQDLLLESVLTWIRELPDVEPRQESNAARGPA